ncbi:glycosyltransferase family 2 protein [Actinoplanes sp. NPDC049599]|uniref:glycosyltransferase family 2 protein n=1 Tax=Actinoplanes sp. NPDC049599 TaxID=3363903 RepID=UPI00379C61D7
MSGGGDRRPGHPLSVVVPVHNAERTLRACLDSVVRQTMSGIEVVAVDDGSTDGSAAVLAEYRDAYPDRVVVLRTGNQGANRARNEALKHVTGAYVVFLDSDDVLAPDMCEKLHTRAVRGDDDVVLCGAYHVHEDGVTRETVGTRLDRQDFNLRDHAYAFVHLSPFPWAKLFRRDLLDGLEFPELSSFAGNSGLYADLVLVFQACSRAGRIGVVEEPLYHYRRTTVRGFSRRTLDVVRAFELVTEDLRRTGRLDGLRDELECVCVRHFLHRYPRLFKRRGDLALKLEFIAATHGFLDREFPRWRRNRYLRRSSRRARAVIRLYAGRARMTRLVRLRAHVPDAVAGPLARRLERINVLTEHR